MFNRIPDLPPKIEPVDLAERPLLSVMVPVYNCIYYLQEAIESVLMQDMGIDLMQIEVVDDCSTDGDVEALVANIGKGRVGYYRQNINSGSLRNFETCINRSKGRYIHLLHGDDRVEPGFYDEIIGLFTNHPEAGAAFTNFNYFDHESCRVAIQTPNMINKPGIIPDFQYKIARHQLVQPPAIVVKRETYEALGSFYAVHFGEDWEMWTRIASRFPVAYSPKMLALYRVAHGIGISHNYFITGKNVTDIKKVIDIVQDYLPDDKKKQLKKEALAYHAKFNIRIANGLLAHNKNAAFRQIQGAWSMDRGGVTMLWLIRFYLLYLLRFKQFQKKWQHNRSTKNSGPIKLKYILN